MTTDIDAWRYNALKNGNDWWRQGRWKNETEIVNETQHIYSDTILLTKTYDNNLYSIFHLKTCKRVQNIEKVNKNSLMKNFHWFLMKLV